MTSSGTGDTPTAPNALHILRTMVDCDCNCDPIMGDMMLNNLRSVCPGEGPLVILDDGGLVRAEFQPAQQLWRISGTGQ